MFLMLGVVDRLVSVFIVDQLIVPTVAYAAALAGTSRKNSPRVSIA